MEGTVTVPAMLAALPLWVAMLRAWNRKDVERFSPVQSAILRVYHITGHDHSQTVSPVQFITIWL